MNIHERKYINKFRKLITITYPLLERFINKPFKKKQGGRNIVLLNNSIYITNNFFTKSSIDENINEFLEEVLAFISGYTQARIYLNEDIQNRKEISEVSKIINLILFSIHYQLIKHTMIHDTSKELIKILTIANLNNKNRNKYSNMIKYFSIYFKDASGQDSTANIFTIDLQFIYNELIEKILTAIEKLQSSETLEVYGFEIKTSTNSEIKFFIRREILELLKKNNKQKETQSQEQAQSSTTNKEQAQSSTTSKDTDQNTDFNTDLKETLQTKSKIENNNINTIREIMKNKTQDLDLSDNTLKEVNKVTIKVQSHKQDLDWIRELENWIQNLEDNWIYSFMTPNKRYLASNIILPGQSVKDRDGISIIDIYIDTSSSMSSENINKLSSLAVKLKYKFEEVTLFTFNDTINEVNLKSQNEIDIVTKGSTNVRNVVQKITERVNKSNNPYNTLNLILTDGQFDDSQINNLRIQGKTVIIFDNNSNARKIMSNKMVKYFYINKENKLININ